jgi:ComF family protein
VLAAPFHFAARLLWPARCPGCDRFVPEGCSFCESCATALLPVTAACPICALPGQGTAGGRCARCARAPPPFAAGEAVLVYGGVASQALLRLKHGGRLDVARPLGRLLLAALIRSGPGVAVIPVPLHPRRLRRRGFNQALELVRAARSAAAPGERRGLPPLWLDALRRQRDTPPLGHLSPDERRAQVADAFLVREPRRVRGRRLLLVDDVMTTGATFGACATALREAGAAHISVLALARAV